MVKIVEVVRKEPKGAGGSYICIGDDGNTYWVKALGSQREFQISEWIAGNLAKAIGLPIAEFCIVDIPYILYENLSDELKAAIGYGPAFGSRQVINAVDFVNTIQDKTPLELKRKLLIFDYWIQNGDRTIGNVNLLWSDSGTVIIDHNLAFDTDFNESEFFDPKHGHVFAKHKDEVFNDLVCVAEYRSLLTNTLEVFVDAFQGIPEEWGYSDLESEFPIDISKVGMKIFSVIKRCLDDEFWEANK